METPQDIISTKIRSTWDHDIIREAETYGAPKGSKRQIIYSKHVALMGNLVDEQIAIFEEDPKKKEWMKAMIELYENI